MSGFLKESIGIARQNGVSELKNENINVEIMAAARSFSLAAESVREFFNFYNRTGRKKWLNAIRQEADIVKNTAIRLGNVINKV